MRPNFLLVIPPVEVAAARFPKESQATAPTVPIADLGFRIWDLSFDNAKSQIRNPKSQIKCRASKSVNR